MFRRSAIAVLATIVALGITQAGSADDGAEEASLYDRLGGLAPISVVAADLIDALVDDDVLNANPEIDAARKRVPAAYLSYQVTSMMCQATGGPCEYTGKGMKDAHAHLNITEAEWDHMVEVFKQVLAKHSVPEKETQELLAIVASTKADIVAPSMN